MELYSKKTKEVGETLWIEGSTCTFPKPNKGVYEVDRQWVTNKVATWKIIDNKAVPDFILPDIWITETELKNQGIYDKKPSDYTFAVKLLNKKKVKKGGILFDLATSLKNQMCPSKQQENVYAFIEYLDPSDGFGIDESGNITIHPKIEGDIEILQTTTDLVINSDGEIVKA